jgi:hypothetical protein
VGESEHGRHQRKHYSRYRHRPRQFRDLLGMIVAYNVLKRAPGQPNVPLLLTLGSRLGIRAIASRFPKVPCDAA